MNILGLNYFFHDSTACIVKEGKLVAAIEEERLNRDKHTRLFPEMSIYRCLSIAELGYEDIDCIAVSIKPGHNRGRKITYAIRNIKSARRMINREIIETFYKQKRFWDWYKHHWPKKKKGPEVEFVEHHLCHAAGSYFVSPYNEAAILSIDGSGEWATTWMGYGKDNRIERLGQSYFPHSLGSFYEAITQFCGFKTTYDEGKTMGLAPFGDAERFYDSVEQMVSVDSNGQLKLDLSYFNFQNLSWKRTSPGFIGVFGESRSPNDDFEQHHKDAAAAFQRVLEEKVLEICAILHAKTGAKHMVLSGGVSLNSVMNGRIIRESPFDDVYIMPAAGDNGTAIGAAFYIYNGKLGKQRCYVHDNPYVGTEYSNEEIRAAIASAKIEAAYHQDICEIAATKIAEGGIIGWLQGSMEIGPRALGSRSILANPCLPEMKDKINAEVKHREAFRPFAPSVTIEATRDYFDLDVEDAFMLKTCNVHESMHDVIPAVTHVDGSARLQTVRKDLHPRYHELILKLGEKTGIPVILNTSFNIQGEPIVESPYDAIRCFFSTGLDVLVMGNYIIEKRPT